MQNFPPSLTPAAHHWVLEKFRAGPMQANNHIVSNVMCVSAVAVVEANYEPQFKISGKSVFNSCTEKDKI
jgi:hypothetical protein